MKFFADINVRSFDEDSWKIKQLAEAGVLGGVTVELYLEFIGDKLDRYSIDKIYQYTTDDCPLIMKCANIDCTAMEYIGQELAKINKNIILTVPRTQDGLRACKALTEQKIQTNIALSCSITQALLAANSGATYISIPADQLENTNDDGRLIIQEICNIYKKYEFKTQILLTSINDLKQIERAANIGVHAVATPSSIFWKLYQDYLTH